MKNRYRIIKELYPNYLILIKKNNKLISAEIDKEIINYLKIKKFRYLKKRKINYLILDNLNIIKIHDYKNDNYETLYMKVSLLKIVKKLEMRLLNEK